jgi:hypothetical protein
MLHLAIVIYRLGTEDGELELVVSQIVNSWLSFLVL